MTPRKLALPFAAICWTLPVAAQVIDAVAPDPLPRNGAGMVFDPVLQRLLVVHGAPADSFVGVMGDFSNVGPASPCSLLLINPVVVASAVTSFSGQACWTMSLPDVTAFRGMHLYEQAAVFDPAGSASTSSYLPAARTATDAAPPRLRT